MSENFKYIELVLDEVSMPKSQSMSNIKQEEMEAFSNKIKKEAAPDEKSPTKDILKKTKKES